LCVTGTLDSEKKTQAGYHSVREPHTGAYYSWCINPEGNPKGFGRYVENKKGPNSEEYLNGYPIY
jgi:hypothetical protein